MHTGCVRGEVMFVIAIDGPAGAGKTTIARALAERFSLEYLNTGAMYRAVAFAALEAGVKVCDNDQAVGVADEAAVVTIARNAEIVVEADKVMLNGIDISADIRSRQVTQTVSPIAAIAGVREHLVEAQRAWAHSRCGGVLEGRDIGTVVFPDAVCKVYLTVDPVEGARRRLLQQNLLQQKQDTPQQQQDMPQQQFLQTVAEDLNQRNRIDSTRQFAPLTACDDAVIVDTTYQSVNDTIERIVQIVEAKAGSAVKSSSS